MLHAVLCTLPVAALQSVIAWIDLAVHYNGARFEENPRSVPGYFFALYWIGTPAQCDSSSVGGATPTATCTLCYFPGAVAIVNLVWTVVFLWSLWSVAAQLARAALNRGLRRRLKVFVALISIAMQIGELLHEFENIYCLWVYKTLPRPGSGGADACKRLSATLSLPCAGCAVMGASVVWSPFSWLNQGLWLGYFATAMVTAVLLAWALIVWPVHEMRAATAVCPPC